MSRRRPSPRPAGLRVSDAGPLLFVLGVLVGLAAALLSERVAALADRDIELVRAVRDLALEEFVGGAEPEELVDDALRGMLAGLDRYSRFYTPEEIGALDRETSGEFHGIGVVFRPPTTEGQVLFPFPASPAERAGIRVGDRFIEVDGRKVAELGPGELQRTIQSAGGRPLPILVEGLDGERRDVVVVPEKVVDPTVRHVRWLDRERGIAYLAIVAFSDRTPREFDRALEHLSEEGLRRLVVDLRGNPGGMLEAAVRVANRFVPSGPIVATRTRDQTRISEAEPDEAHFVGLPLVLLVDQSSASASEVLAGALQDHCAAALVGEPTYGKGSVQTLRRIEDDRGIVKMTTAVYFTPAWRRIDRGPEEDGQGLVPDHLVELAPEESHAIHAFLMGYTPPPEVVGEIEAWEELEEAELLPEPPPDRQLEAALALLRGDEADAPHAARAF